MPSPRTRRSTPIAADLRETLGGFPAPPGIGSGAPDRTPPDTEDRGGVAGILRDMPSFSPRRAAGAALMALVLVALGAGVAHAETFAQASARGAGAAFLFAL